MNTKKEYTMNKFTKYLEEEVNEKFKVLRSWEVPDGGGQAEEIQINKNIRVINYSGDEVLIKINKSGGGWQQDQSLSAFITKKELKQLVNYL